MTTLEILQFLQRDIHSTVLATVDAAGLPQTCVIDMMLCDEQGLYFLTAKGKKLYERLTETGFVAVSGMKGADTMSTVSISLRGKIRSIGQKRLDEIFEKNPYMAKIYPNEAGRAALEVFQIYEASGELFDLSQNPVYRQSFAYGGAAEEQGGYRVDPEKCIGCESCRSVCPVQCISAAPCEIDVSRCLHCGNCYEICPARAIEKVG